MAIQVFVADEQSDQPVDLPRWRGLAERVLSDRGVPSDSELNVLYVDEETIASLNLRFLGHEGPTDVLSFPIEDEIAVPGPPPSGPNVLVSGPGRDGEDEDSMPTMLGDVLICPAVAARNAPDHAGTFDAELALLLVHGILHLLGLDHEDDGEAEEMEAIERDLLARLAPAEAGSDGAE